jgi:uncharacterized protein (DUF302 family)
MGFFKGLFSLIGGVVVLVGLVAYLFMGDTISKAQKLDPKAIGLYMDMADGVLKTGDAAATMVKTVKVEDDISIEDVVETMKSVAMDNNMLVVGDTIMFRDGEKDVFGNDTRHVEIVSFCNKQIARDFIDYSVAFGAFMPCRVILTRGKDGALYLSTMKLDLMIAGGFPLTPKMLEMAEKVRDTMYAIVDKAAEGDF